mmetsp:Transcript_33214/g.54049  ORF Transcript_33214/g.54049 Transcript_33214/m.54049 type:complete len:248 (+) Transcript_33214:916-1659(+)
MRRQILSHHTQLGRCRRRCFLVHKSYRLRGSARTTITRHRCFGGRIRRRACCFVVVVVVVVETDIDTVSDILHIIHVAQSAIGEGIVGQLHAAHVLRPFLRRRNIIALLWRRRRRFGAASRLDEFDVTMMANGAFHLNRTKVAHLVDNGGLAEDALLRRILALVEHLTHLVLPLNVDFGACHRVNDFGASHLIFSRRNHVERVQLLQVDQLIPAHSILGLFNLLRRVLVCPRDRLSRGRRFSFFRFL